MSASASNYTQAVSDIKFLAARFRGVLAVVDRVDELAGVENLIKEAQRSLDDVRATIVKEQNRYRQDMETEKQKTAKDREDILAKARVDAAAVVKEANDQIARLRQSISEATEALSALNENITAAESSRDAILKETNDLRIEVTSLREEREKIEKLHASLGQRLAGKP